jgi:[ribosomal protein S5]-alanine N-acetyltransferase
MTVSLITTRRLIFDELTVGRDEPFIFQLLNERGFIDNIGDRGITDLQAASAYIQDGQLRSYRENGFGLWRVCSRDSGQALGLCGLVRRAGLVVPDVGYAFLEGVWGQGLAQEAAAATVAYARDRLGLSSLAAIAKPDNKASLRVLEKVGFLNQGLIDLPGQAEPNAYFTLSTLS